MKTALKSAGKAAGTRKKLLDAGLKLISKRGYLGATTKDIAKKAGVAELTLFRHFSSKELLFQEIINSYTFLPALKGLMPEIKTLDYRDALLLISDKFLRRLYERRDLVRIMRSEMHLYPSKVKDIYHNFIGEVNQTLASYFRELQGGGTLRDFDPEYGARAFLGMFLSFFTVQELMFRKDAMPLELDKVKIEFVDIFVRGTVR